MRSGGKGSRADPVLWVSKKIWNSTVPQLYLMNQHFFSSQYSRALESCRTHLWVVLILRSPARLRSDGLRQAETSTLTFQKIQALTWGLFQITPLPAMWFDMQQIYWLFSLEKFHTWHITSSHKCSKWNKIRPREKIRQCVKMHRSYKSLSLPIFPLIKKKGRFSRCS